jgi:ABC-type transport system involved in cytochrome bd biosynthesis fused ATPase/permease subunit
VPILLLDEPGLGLDPDAERLLATRLAQDLGDTTLIMVTHSGELINAAQRLLVLDGGRLVADGPREQLLRAR